MLDRDLRPGPGDRHRRHRHLQHPGVRAHHARRGQRGVGARVRARGARRRQGPWRITLDHVLPNIASVLIVQATIQFATAILAEAALSYLGLGTQPPMPSWGRMLNEAQTQMFQAPQLAIYPGAGDRAGGARPEPDGRRPARPARSEAGAQALGARKRKRQINVLPSCGRSGLLRRAGGLVGFLGLVFLVLLVLLVGLLGRGTGGAVGGRRGGLRGHGKVAKAARIRVESSLFMGRPCLIGLANPSAHRRARRGIQRLLAIG